MIVVMGRPGLGKSWLDLLFVASAVLHGAKVGLYPLEMTLEETALRLYTIFSCKMFGANKALRNLDLANGRVSKARVVKLMNILEDRYEGQLFVADIGSMSDPYTVDRVEAEQEVYKFDLQWIDYLTLMKAPGIGRDGGEDHMTVKALSNGCKQIAVRHNTVVGVSAQVSREAIRGRHFLPRLEHIGYGDAIGQDADHVIPINRRGEYLYYGMTKNRHGPEIGKTRVQFAVNEGAIQETEDQDDDDDD
jgi:replicative DNA helicase